MQSAIWVTLTAIGISLSLTGCARIHSGHQSKELSSTSSPIKEPSEIDSLEQNKSTPQYVDISHGFSIQSPNSSWKFQLKKKLSTKTIEVPVIVANVNQGAQVVVQIAPAVATPFQFAEKLTSGLKHRPGFTTSTVSPQQVAAGAVGFDFSAGEQVLGRVTILEGQGKVFVLLATWPRSAPLHVKSDIEQIIGSIRTDYSPN